METSFLFHTLIKRECLTVFLGILKKEEMTDSIRTSAEEIRESIKKVDFDLGDRFCDSNDLQESWVTIKIPDLLFNPNTPTNDDI